MFPECIQFVAQVLIMFVIVLTMETKYLPVLVPPMSTLGIHYIMSQLPMIRSVKSRNGHDFNFQVNVALILFPLRWTSLIYH